MPKSESRILEHIESRIEDLKRKAIEHDKRGQKIEASWRSSQMMELQDLVYWITDQSDAKEGNDDDS